MSFEFVRCGSGAVLCSVQMTTSQVQAVCTSLEKADKKWLYEAIENCKIHALGAVHILLNGMNKGRYGVAVLTETNMQNIVCHFIRAVDLHAFSPIRAIVFEQQLYMGMVYSPNPQRPSEHSFNLKDANIILRFESLEESQRFYSNVQRLFERENEMVPPEDAIAHNNFNYQRLDPNLQEAIKTAEKATHQRLNAFYKTHSILDEFAMEEKREKAVVKSSPVVLGKNRFPPPPSEPAPPPPGVYVPPVRPLNVDKWSEKFQKKNEGEEIIIKVNLINVGGRKTMKVGKRTLVSDLIQRIAKQHNISNPALYGLFRRSGLQLDSDLTLEDLDLRADDEIELHKLNCFT